MSSIENYLTDDVIKQLYSYTKKKTAKLKKSPFDYQLETRDVVHEVISQLLSNKESWDRALYPNIFVYLAQNVKKTIQKKVRYIDKNQQYEGDISFNEQELDLAFLRFKNLINYLHENKKELIQDAEKKLLGSK